MNQIGLPEFTEEALENFLDDKMTSLFLLPESKEIIREEFKRFQNGEPCGIDFHIMRKR